MTGTVADTVHTIDDDLAQLTRRMDNAREIIHRALIDLTSMEYRRDVLLDRRLKLGAINDAAAATMRPGAR